MITDKNKVAVLERFISREKSPIDYSDEMNFYNLVKLGRKDEVASILSSGAFELNTQKLLCENPLQSMKYHLVVTAALLARFCIEGGMELNRAYEISDKYIGLADGAKTYSEVISINSRMCMEYTSKMEKLHKETVFSKPVIKSIDYIYNNLYRRISVDEIASAIGLNTSYYSKLFHKETGITVSRFILLRKIEASRNLLINSDYSCSEISELLAFSSQSHFISVFRKECGMTPLAYRNKYYNHMGLNE